MLIFCINAITSENRANIEISITNFNNDKGYAVVALFKSPKGFPDNTKDAFLIKRVKISSKISSCDFKNIEHGNYAIAVYHDANNNGKLDNNFFGIPTEGLAVSNNIKASWTAPTFEEAQFSVTNDTFLKINIINP